MGRLDLTTRQRVINLHLLLIKGYKVADIYDKLSDDIETTKKTIYLLIRKYT